MKNNICDTCYHNKLIGMDVPQRRCTELGIDLPNKEKCPSYKTDAQAKLDMVQDIVIPACREVKTTACTDREDYPYNMVEFYSTPRDILCNIDKEVIIQYLKENKYL